MKRRHVDVDSNGTPKLHHGKCRDGLAGQGQECAARSWSQGLGRGMGAPLIISSRTASHEVIISEVAIVVIMASVRDVSTASNQGRLGLGSLGLLAALVGSLLLPHLLVSQGSDSTGELLDLLAGHLFGKGLGEVLEEEAVLGALCVGRKDGTQNCAEVVELSLGLGLEKGQLGNVDSVGRVAGVDDDSSSSGLGPAGADSDVSKHVGGVGEIGLLLGTSKSLTLLGLGLLDHLNVGGVGLLLGSVGLVLSNTLALGLLCGGGGFSSLGLGLGSLALLLALYLGVFGGIPRIEDIAIVFLIVKLAAGSSGTGNLGRARGAAIVAVLVVYASIR